VDGLAEEARARAIELRSAGWSVNDIALELGVARSTAWRWVQHLPLDQDSERARHKRAHAKVMTDARWEGARLERDCRRAAVTSAAAAGVGALSDRELLLIGAAIYWCEGAKTKPWSDQERVLFVNSDVGLVRLFRRFLALVGVTEDRIVHRLYIHESADIDAADRWWREQLGLVDRSLPVSVKRHKLGTSRGNRGDDYHGCLAVSVRRGRELYWRIAGLADALTRPVVSGAISDADVG
jgi:hypothetical protein